MTHNCGTYNLTYMETAHAMPDCDIIFEQTLGVVKPKTFGGRNGDISRVYFQKGCNEFARLTQNAKNYLRFKTIARQISLSKRMGSVKVSPEDMKFYKKNFEEFKRKTL